MGLGALYRLGEDEILRRCTLVDERMELLEEAHDGVVGGHMSKEVIARILLQANY